MLQAKASNQSAHNDQRETKIARKFYSALSLVALRAAGEQLGWGFQLQSPAVVTVLAILFFALALNLSGLFEFGMFAPRSVAGWSAQNRTLDAFAGGVLAVVVASPCTAPFMGAALGYAITQPVGETILVFVALGLGMALPFAALAWCCRSSDWPLLLVLRAGGEQVGWGFQLQSTAVIAALAALFTLIGLNLAGVFEFGSVLPSGLASLRARHPLVDSLLTGVTTLAPGAS